MHPDRSFWDVEDSDDEFDTNAPRVWFKNQTELAEAMHSLLQDLAGFQFVSGNVRCEKDENGETLCFTHRNCSIKIEGEWSGNNGLKIFAKFENIQGLEDDFSTAGNFYLYKNAAGKKSWLPKGIVEDKFGAHSHIDSACSTEDQQCKLNAQESKDTDQQGFAFTLNDGGDRNDRCRVNSTESEDIFDNDQQGVVLSAIHEGSEDDQAKVNDAESKNTEQQGFSSTVIDDGSKDEDSKADSAESKDIDGNDQQRGGSTDDDERKKCYLLRNIVAFKELRLVSNDVETELIFEKNMNNRLVGLQWGKRLKKLLNRMPMKTRDVLRQSTLKIYETHLKGQIQYHEVEKIHSKIHMNSDDTSFDLKVFFLMKKNGLENADAGFGKNDNDIVLYFENIRRIESEHQQQDLPTLKSKIKRVHLVSRFAIDKNAGERNLVSGREKNLASCEVCIKKNCSELKLDCVQHLSKRFSAIEAYLRGISSILEKFMLPPEFGDDSVRPSTLEDIAAESTDSLAKMVAKHGVWYIRCKNLKAMAADWEEEIQMWERIKNTSGKTWKSQVNAEILIPHQNDMDDCLNVNIKAQLIIKPQKSQTSHYFSKDVHIASCVFEDVAIKDDDGSYDCLETYLFQKLVELTPASNSFFLRKDDIDHHLEDIVWNFGKRFFGHDLESKLWKALRIVVDPLLAKLTKGKNMGKKDHGFTNLLKLHKVLEDERKTQELIQNVLEPLVMQSTHPVHLAVGFACSAQSQQLQTKNGAHSSLILIANHFSKYAAELISTLPMLKEDRAMIDLVKGGILPGKFLSESANLGLTDILSSSAIQVTLSKLAWRGDRAYLKKWRTSRKEKHLSKIDKSKSFCSKISECLSIVALSDEKLAQKISCFPLYRKTPAGFALVELMGHIVLLYVTFKFMFGRYDWQTFKSETALYIDFVMLLILVSGKIFCEFGNMMRLRKMYFSLWNICDLVSCACYAAWFIFLGSHVSLAYRFLCINGTVGVFKFYEFLAWEAQFGPVVFMILQMVKEVVRFIVIFAIILFGFATTMHSQFYGMEVYDSVSSSALTLLEVSMGNVDYTIFPEGEEGYVWGVILTTIFLLVFAILLLNLLIAILSNTYDDIKGKSKGAWCSIRVEFLAQRLRGIESCTRSTNFLILLPPPFNLVLVPAQCLEFAFNFKKTIRNFTGLIFTWKKGFENQHKPRLRDCLQRHGNWVYYCYYKKMFRSLEIEYLRLVGEQHPMSILHYFKKAECSHLDWNPRDLGTGPWRFFWHIPVGLVDFVMYHTPKLLVLFWIVTIGVFLFGFVGLFHYIMLALGVIFVDGKFRPCKSKQDISCQWLRNFWSVCLNSSFAFVAALFCILGLLISGSICLSIFEIAWVFIILICGVCECFNQVKCICNRAAGKFQLPDDINNGHATLPCIYRRNLSERSQIRDLKHALNQKATKPDVGAIYQQTEDIKSELSSMKQDLFSLRDNQSGDESSMAVSVQPIWEEHVDPNTNRTYYFNPETGQSCWDNPFNSQGVEESVLALEEVIQERDEKAAEVKDLKQKAVAATIRIKALQKLLEAKNITLKMRTSDETDPAASLSQQAQKKQIAALRLERRLREKEEKRQKEEEEEIFEQKRKLEQIYERQSEASNLFTQQLKLEQEHQKALLRRRIKERRRRKQQELQTKGASREIREREMKELQQSADEELRDLETKYKMRLSAGIMAKVASWKQRMKSRKFQTESDPKPCISHNSEKDLEEQFMWTNGDVSNKRIIEGCPPLKGSCSPEKNFSLDSLDTRKKQIPRPPLPPSSPSTNKEQSIVTAASDSQGLHGLYNGGRNICFMNSIVQFLRNTPPFSTSVDSNSNNTPKEIILNFFARMKEAGHITYAKKIHDIIQSDIIDAYEKGRPFDAGEFLLRFLEVSDALNYFGGTVTRKKQCTNPSCNLSPTISQDPFSILLLPNTLLAGKGIDVQAAVTMYASDTELVDDYLCENCCSEGKMIRSKCEISQSIKMSNSSSSLIISLGIFDGSCPPYRKMLSTFQDIFQDEKNRKLLVNKISYKLKAVVCHIGDSMHSAHYVTYQFLLNGKKWQRFDDEKTDTYLENYDLLPPNETPYILLYLPKKPDQDSGGESKRDAQPTSQPPRNSKDSGGESKRGAQPPPQPPRNSK